MALPPVVVSTAGAWVGDHGQVTDVRDGSQAGERARHRGPKRPKGPVGPDAVTDAVLEAAATLFAEQGVDHVSLRDIAEAADVQLALIGRYVGNRAELIDAVFRRVNADTAAELAARPLELIAHDRNSTVGRYLALLNHYAVVGRPPPTDGPNPIRALADVFEQHLGLDRESARRRAAQVAATSLGWRLFEDYLVTAAELDGVDPEDLRSDLNAIQRQIGSTRWPTPPVG